MTWIRMVLCITFIVLGTLQVLSTVVDTLKGVWVVQRITVQHRRAHDYYGKVISNAFGKPSRITIPLPFMARMLGVSQLMMGAVMITFGYNG